MTNAKAPEIKMCDCSSESIAQYGYDAETKTLAVRFKNGSKLYHFTNVPQDAADSFTSAKSKGSHFQKHIRGNFDFTTID